MEAYLRWQHVVTQDPVNAQAQHDLTQFGQHSHGTLQTPFTATFSPAAKARSLGVPHALTGTALTASSVAYSLPYYHAFYF